MAEPLPVWRSIADHDNIHVRLSDELPAACGGGTIVRRSDGSVWILIERALDPDRRRAVLLHELVHLERGTARCQGAPCEWAAVVAREEATVNRIVAERLVPEDELLDFVRRCLSIADYVTALDVADEFGVPVDVAELACRMAA